MMCGLFFAGKNPVGFANKEIPHFVRDDFREEVHWRCNWTAKYFSVVPQRHFTL